MNVQELESSARLGNWYLGFTDKPFQLEKRDFWSMYEVVDIDEIVKEPLQLTEKWLLDFGFIRHHNDYFNSVLIVKNVVDFERGMPNNEFVFKIFPKTDLESAQDVMNAIKIQFVHQLQNLYYSITGDELQVVS